MSTATKMTVKGGTSPACAACKYQRRKCSADCVLAPYFPANQHKSFQNAHRLFGVSKIAKMLEQLNTLEKKEEAMKSIKYESDMRERYPVYGCAGIIYQLRQQLRQAMEELHYVYAQLAVYRQQIPNNQQQLGCSSSDYSSAPHQSHLLHLGNMMNNSYNTTQSIDTPPFFQHHSDGCIQDYEMPFTMDYFLANENENYGDDADDDEGVRHGNSNDHVAKPLLGLEPVYTNAPIDPYCDLIRNNINSVVGKQPQVVANSNQAFGIQPEIRVFDQDYESMPFNAMVDDRQSYVETQEACESSSAESSFRDFPQPVEQVSEMESELRTAAACFSLTSVK